MSSLQFALSMLTDEPKRDDEFTIQDLINEAEAKGRTITQDQASNRIKRLVDSGKYKKRKIRLNGSVQNVYSIA